MFVGLLLLLLLLPVSSAAQALLRDQVQTTVIVAAAGSPATCTYAPDKASCVKLSYEGFQAVGVVVGDGAARLVAEISGDGGLTWASVNVIPIQTIFTTPTATITGPGTYAFATLGGGQLAQIRALTYTSGAIRVTLRSTMATK